MTEKMFELDGHRVRLYGTESPAILFLQPVDERDALLLEPQLEAMERCAVPFALAAFEVNDWNRDLSPWKAPPVFGKIPFDGGAEETLRFVTDRLMAALPSHLALKEETGLCLGGYSLAGLFSLWASSRTALFTGVAAASPSVWFPGWIDYVKEHPIQATTVYLSLGEREERTKNPVMASVGACIREQYALLQERHIVTLEWNPGNHFQDSGKRTARAFCWTADPERKN